MPAGLRLLLPNADRLQLPNGDYLLLPGSLLDDRSGIWVSVAGNVMPATRDWSITRGAGVTATARYRMIGRREDFTYFPRDDDEIEIRAADQNGVLLFGGYVDAPRIRVNRAGLLSVAIGAVGWRHRLNDRRLTQADGIDIVKMSTATDQVTALVALLAGEGFTSVVDLATPDVPSRGDMRFRYVGPILDEIAQLNDAILVVLPDRTVEMRSRSELTASHTFTWVDIDEVGFEGSRQDYRTRHVVRGGDLLQQQTLTGNATGEYRLGGVQNLDPARSVFDVTGIGNGVLWIDERARGGRGDTAEAVLLLAADGADPLPASLVSTSDREIDSIILSRAGLSFNGVGLAAPATTGLAVRAADDTEYGWAAGRPTGDQRRRRAGRPARRDGGRLDHVHVAMGVEPGAGDDSGGRRWWRRRRRRWEFVHRPDWDRRICGH